jgi:hypothetical protein
MPNPLDLSLFNKTCFLNNGEIRFKVASSESSSVQQFAGGTGRPRIVGMQQVGSTATTPRYIG